MPRAGLGAMRRVVPLPFLCSFLREGEKCGVGCGPEVLRLSFESDAVGARLAAWPVSGAKLSK